jgi:hypothetical protein
MDMHSGGHLKTPYTHIYIDEPLGEAIKTFKKLFKCDPDNVTCKCCGEDFVYEEHSSIEEATAYDRDCKWTGKKYDLESAEISVDDYLKTNKVLFVCEP